MKFIVADPSEQRHLPSDVVENCVFVTGLETLTGADFLITPSKIPINEKTLPIHIAKGLCVQRKDVGDLVASFQGGDNRLWRQLIRLKMLSSPPWLLLVGDIKAKNKTEQDGSRKFCAVVDGRDTDINYFAVIGSIDAWQRHGGYYSWISRDTLMLAWCELQYRNLVAKERRGGWSKTLITRGIIKPLELLTEVETTLCTIPGLGTERARAVYTEAQKYWDRPTLIDCFRILKDNKIEGIGDKTKNTTLKFIGWGNGESR